MVFQWISVTTAALGAMAAPVLGTAQDYQAGLIAYGAGDYKTAFENWAPIAAQGDVDAQFNLAVMFADGEGVIRDFSEAVRWFRLSAEQGDAPSQFNLAGMYASGMGVPTDFATAHMWYSVSEVNGVQSARSSREFLEESMTRADIDKAVVRARDCIASNYANCD